jgi:hypothetical protein
METPLMTAGAELVEELEVAEAPIGRVLIKPQREASNNTSSPALQASARNRLGS